MADLSFHCPNCSQEMVIDAAGAGLEIECPGCKQNIRVPDSADASARAMSRTGPGPTGRTERIGIIPPESGSIGRAEWDKALKARAAHRRPAAEINPGISLYKVVVFSLLLLATLYTGAIHLREVQMSKISEVQ
jgi:DNA-directed RNA polymerase subunit RPC12/RpoP